MQRKYAVIGGVVLLAVAGAAAAATLPGATVVDVYPTKGMVKPGEAATLAVKVERPWYEVRPVTVTITAGLSSEPVATLKTKGDTVTWTPAKAGGYGVTAQIGRSKAETAIDVGDQWTEKPRYGFLSDFHPLDAGKEDRFATMAKFHINGLQFYDWMYRHSDYLPPTTEFQDPLNRTLSLDTIKEKLDLSHKYGMATMAYTAIYGAPKSYLDKHPEQGLYNLQGKPISFGNGFLYIMNPEKDGPWAKQMLSEYSKIVQQLPFDGIHLDQYGDPKFGFRYPGGEGATGVQIAPAIVSLIDETKKAVGPAKSVIFNDVNTWPLADTAPTTNDAVYVEVWPPNVNFQNLSEIIGKGRQLSGGKPVVLAAYLNPEWEPSVLLTDATIFASGGYHIEMGEGNALLADPYFPKYKRMSPALEGHLRRYYDLTVRYQDLLYGKDLKDWAPEVTMGETRVLKMALFNGVWATGRENEKYQVLSLVNFSGLDHARWNAERKNPPTVLEKQPVTVAMAKAPKAAFLINPDGADQAPVPVKFTYANGQVSLTLDRLDYWSMLVFEK